MQISLQIAGMWLVLTHGVCGGSKRPMPPCDDSETILVEANNPRCNWHLVMWVT